MDLDESITNNPGVYIIRNTRAGKAYIDSSVTVQRRLQDHRCKLEKGRHPNNYLQRAWNRDGGDAFEAEVLEYYIGQDCLAIRLAEERWLHELRCFDRAYGYNLNISTVSAGGIMSEETRARLSEQRKGRRLSANHRQLLSLRGKGRVVPAETKAKISRALKGRPLSPEHKKKLAAAKRGRSLSDEHKKRVGERNRGRRLSDQAKAAIGAVQAKSFPGLVAPDGTIYPEITNLTRFCREHGLTTPSVWHLLRGKTRQHKGWTRYCP